MDTTLILFSGLAGTGKSTLAHALAHALKIPVVSFDYFIDYALPRHVLNNPANWTNQDVFEMMNKLADQQLSLGLSVILDAVYFSQASRASVRAVAEKCQVRFRAIHTTCSDKAVWRDRVVARAINALPNETPAQWDRVMAELNEFQPWSQEDALFVDSIRPVEENLQRMQNYLVQPKTP